MDLTLPQLAESLRTNLQLTPGESLYGLVDGAQDLALASEAKCLFGQQIRMLFEGDVAAALADVAPYLVPIDPDSGYLENWACRWGQNVGVLLTTSAAQEQLFRHLRDLFVVQDEAGQSYFFRFYDPRVLRLYLPTCTSLERSLFFGPIGRFLLCGEEPGSVLLLEAEREKTTVATLFPKGREAMQHG